jgi:O-antigen ligase
MIKDTILLGHGADTFCLYFPHSDYVGKYNSGSFSKNINIVVDKPHDLYFGYIIGTGLVSLIALLTLWFSYVVQSFRLYVKNDDSDFTTFAGLGIFLGICGFLVAALVNDSSVSVTPMFYGLLGTGIAINIMIKQRKSKNEIQ